MDNRTLRTGFTLQGGKYRILSVLGQGGFGITYLAEQTGLGMRVAIKEFFLKGSCQREITTSRVSVPVNDNEELVNRCQRKFKAEARKIASLNNDHIVNIIDVFDENGTSYYVMKYLGGGSLASMLKSGPLPEKTALQMIGEISDALKSVHSSGLLHLDVKPANILLDERGRSVLIDFGVSKYVDSQQDSSTTSSLIGFSRGFAPLEQVNSTITSLSPATDIYALGATLYNLVTGICPPEASVVMDSGLSGFPAGLSEEVKNAITEAMQPRRKDRPQSIDAFLELLPQEEVETESEETVIMGADNVSMDPVPDPKPAPRPSRLPVILSSALFAASLAVFFFTFAGKNNDSGSAAVAVEAADLSGQNAQIDSLTALNKNLQKTVNDLNAQVKSLTSKNSNLQQQVRDVERQRDSYKDDAGKWRRHLASQ